MFAALLSVPASFPAFLSSATFPAFSPIRDRCCWLRSDIFEIFSLCSETGPTLLDPNSVHSCIQPPPPPQWIANNNTSDHTLRLTSRRQCLQSRVFWGQTLTPGFHHYVAGAVSVSVAVSVTVSIKNRVRTCRTYAVAAGACARQ